MWKSHYPLEFNEYVWERIPGRISEYEATRMHHERFGGVRTDPSYMIPTTISKDDNTVYIEKHGYTNY